MKQIKIFLCAAVTASLLFPVLGYAADEDKWVGLPRIKPMTEMDNYACDKIERSEGKQLVFGLKGDHKVLLEDVILDINCGGKNATLLEYGAASRAEGAIRDVIDYLKWRQGDINKPNLLVNILNQKDEDGTTLLDFVSGIRDNARRESSAKEFDNIYNIFKENGAKHSSDL